MGYEWDKSYKKDYVPRKEDMVIQKGKLIGFTVEYSGERDVLYLEGDRSAYVEIQNTRRYQYYCIWTLKELKPRDIVQNNAKLERDKAKHERKLKRKARREKNRKKSD